MAHMTNPLATPEQLYLRHSFNALPPDLQDVVFFATQCLTQAAGLLLELPQSVTAQANVLLARYWLIDPVMSNEFSDVSAAAVYLVAKLGPLPRSPRDVCNVYSYLLSPASSLFRQAPTSPNDPDAYVLSESAYQSARDRMLRLEARILYALGFDAHVSLPHPLAVTYLQALDFLGQHPRGKDATEDAQQQQQQGGDGADGDGGRARREGVAALAMRYLNTALLSPQLLYVTHQPNALAVAAVYNAARDAGAKMPECAWWEAFDVDREELGFLVVGMRSLEGWVRKMREDVPRLREGMVSRAVVAEELRRRGLSPSGGGGGGGGGGGAAAGGLSGNGNGVVPDEEEKMMRAMDERIAQMESTQ